MSNNGEPKTRTKLTDALKGEIIVWIITLLVSVIAVLTPIIKLNTTITRLDATIDSLNKIVDKTVIRVDEIDKRLLILETEYLYKDFQP